MKIIDLGLELNFTEAAQYLQDGKCIGIRPKGNTNFLVKYKPDWMSGESSDYLLCWSRSVIRGKGDSDLKTTQYLGTWSPVVIDSNDLPENIKQSFIQENIIGLSD